MDNNRTPVVTEARFALTILICVLVAVGYVVLLRLSGPSDSPMEVQKPVVTPHEMVHDETEPLVLPIDKQKPQMTKRPGDPKTTSAHNYGVLPASGADDLQRR
jgi:hypothetical protein